MEQGAELQLCSTEKVEHLRGVRREGQVKNKRTELGDMGKEQIDANLRRIFNDDADEDLPDDLRSLIDRLDVLDDSDDPPSGEVDTQ